MFFIPMDSITDEFIMMKDGECYNCHKKYTIRSNSSHFDQKCPECLTQRLIVSDKHQEITCLICFQRKLIPKDLTLNYCLDCKREYVEKPVPRLNYRVRRQCILKPTDVLKNKGNK